jgi:hypothetical protein
MAVHGEVGTRERKAMTIYPLLLPHCYYRTSNSRVHVGTVLGTAYCDSHAAANEKPATGRTVHATKGG